LWAGPGHDPGAVWFRKRIAREKILGDRVEQIRWNHIAGEGIANPFSRGILPRSKRIVDRHALPAKREVSVVHRIVRHVPEHHRLAPALQDRPKGSQEEGPV